MLKNIKHHWQRTISGLLALVMTAGMLPASVFAADNSSNPYAPTGNFELNVAGATAWNGAGQPIPVYDTETGSVEMAAIPSSVGADPVPFVLLEDNGGDRVKVGLVANDNGCVIGWTGSYVDGAGWVDKDNILVNLPDVLPSITYAAPDTAEKQFNSRLTRFEYVVPCQYRKAEQLAKDWQAAEGETIFYTLSGEWPNITRAYSADPDVTLTRFCTQEAAPASDSGPTGNVGAYNPGSPGGKKPTTSNVDWSTDPERTFLRFTLIEFPQGVVTDLNTNDWSTWHVVGTPLNVVWSKTC